MTDRIKHTADLIDSREVIERIEELEDLAPRSKELKALIELQDQCDYGDWEHGATLINDNYFTEHAKQEAHELYGTDYDEWPYRCIDWDEAAEELQQDYMCVTFIDQDFWIRA